MLKKVATKFAGIKKEYFKQWVYDEPIFIDKNHNDRLHQLQKIMYKMINCFVLNYPDLKHLMPVNERVSKILEVWSNKPYKIGTYRTDFVYDDKQQPKIIEITCRFSLNGMFMASIMNQIASDFKNDNCPGLVNIDIYSDIFEYFQELYGDTKKIYILKGGDIRNESKLYVDIFEKLGFTVKDVNYDKIEEHINDMKDAWIITELALEEIENIDLEIHEKLATCNVINEFRTILLIHDKRFFSVLGSKELQESALTEEEQLFFSEYYIPTYKFSESPISWENARQNKDNWILKHSTLGKSQKIYAGIVTSEKEWESIFLNEEINMMVLQKWIPQKTIKGTIGQEEFEDYITGTLLFFDDHYFGFGDFRTSSFPVTNKVDHRKAVSLIVDKEQLMDNFSNFKNLIE